MISIFSLLIIPFTIYMVSDLHGKRITNFTKIYKFNFFHFVK
jgi:hypothetical protein